MQATCFISQVIKGLHMTSEDINKFTERKVIHNKYRRHIVYDMTKNQIACLVLIVHFQQTSSL